jgi:hypothetical protein
MAGLLQDNSPGYFERECQEIQRLVLEFESEMLPKSLCVRLLSTVEILTGDGIGWA